MSIFYENGRELCIFCDECGVETDTVDQRELVKLTKELEAEGWVVRGLDNHVCPNHKVESCEASTGFAINSAA